MKLLNDLGKYNSGSLMCNTGHCGIKGNEMTDQLALWDKLAVYRIIKSLSKADQLQKPMHAYILRHSKTVIKINSEKKNY